MAGLVKLHCGARERGEGPDRAGRDIPTGRAETGPWLRLRRTHTKKAKAALHALAGATSLGGRNVLVELGLGGVCLLDLFEEVVFAAVLRGPSVIGRRRSEKQKILFSVFYFPGRRTRGYAGPAGTGAGVCASSSRRGGFRDGAASSESRAWTCPPVHVLCTAVCTGLCTSSSSSESGFRKTNVFKGLLDYWLRRQG